MAAGWGSGRECSHEVKFSFHFLQRFAGESFGAGGFVELGEASLAFGLLGEVMFTFEGAVGEASEGVEHAEVVEGVSGDGVPKGLSAEFGEDLTDVSGSHLVGSLEG